MKRYGTTPNRLSNATQKKVVRTGNNTKRIGIIIAMAIVMVIGFTWKRLNPRRFTGKRRYWFRDGHILNKQK